MQESHLEKEFLRDRILPLLFSSKSANLFVSARNAFDEFGTSIDNLQNRYDSVEKEEEDFWTNIAKLVSSAYNSDLPDFSEREFREFIQELLRIRFDKEFRKNDVRKLDGGTDIDSFLSEIEGGHNLVLDKSGSNRRLLYVGERTSREFMDPLRPTDAEFYPPLLIEANGKKSEIRLSGDKDQRNRFVSDTKTRDTINLQDEEPEAYEELDINLNFIQNLKDHGIYLKDIRISDEYSDVSVSVSSDDGAIDVQDFVDYDLLIQNKQDIISLTRCKFVYVKKEVDVEFTLNFQKFKRNRGNEEYIKISLELAANLESHRSEIEEILENYGIEPYEPYYMPLSYYFNKILTTNSNFRNKYFAPLDEMDGTDNLAVLTDGGIIDPEADDGISMNKENLAAEIRSKLEEAEQVDIEFDGRQHRIARLDEYENNRLALVLKSYSDDAQDDHTRFYRVVIPFRARPDNFEKIYNVILLRTNYHKILTSESAEERVEYIVKAAHRQMKYDQRMLVEKEARRSAKVLDEYYQNPKNVRERFDTPAEAGYVIEDHLNVLLRYMFRDYLHGGGPNESDGALRLKDEYYLVDSKQRSDLPRKQYTKAHQDVDGSEYSGLVGSDNMIFIISKRLLLSNTQSGSLNYDNRKQVEKGQATSFHFISVEGVNELYEIFSENINILRSSSDICETVFSEVKDMIDDSAHCEDCEELTENEERCLGTIRKMIDRSRYMPEDRNRYF